MSARISAKAQRQLEKRRQKKAEILRRNSLSYRLLELAKKVIAVIIALVSLRSKKDTPRATEPLKNLNQTPATEPNQTPAPQAPEPVCVALELGEEPAPSPELEHSAPIEEAKGSGERSTFSLALELDGRFGKMGPTEVKLARRIANAANFSPAQRLTVHFCFVPESPSDLAITNEPIPDTFSILGIGSLMITGSIDHKKQVLITRILRYAVTGKMFDLETRLEECSDFIRTIPIPEETEPLTLLDVKYWQVSHILDK